MPHNASLRVMKLAHPELQRDMDLIRLLLLGSAGYDVEEELKDYTGEQMAFHIALLKDAGFVDAEVTCNEHGFPAVAAIIRLTWNGYEFLELAKDSKAWKASKDVLQKAGSWSVSLLLEWLKAEAKSHIPGFEHVLPPHP